MRWHEANGAEDLPMLFFENRVGAVDHQVSAGKRRWVSNNGNDPPRLAARSGAVSRRGLVRAD